MRVWEVATRVGYADGVTLGALLRRRVTLRWSDSLNAATLRVPNRTPS